MFDNVGGWRQAGLCVRTGVLCGLALGLLGRMAWAVPWVDWQAEEDKLLGRQPVALEDLPDEWQGLSAPDLQAAVAGDLNSADAQTAAAAYDQARPLYQRSLYAARYSGDAALASQLLLKLGQGYQSQEERERALAYYEQALAASRQAADTTQEMEVLLAASDVCRMLDQADTALDYAGQALELAKQSGDSTRQSQASSAQGDIYADQEQPDQALTCFENALEAAERANDVDLQVSAHSALGSLYQDLGQIDKQVQHDEAAMALINQQEEITSDEWVWVYVLSLSLGLGYTELGNFENALAYYQQFLDLSRAFKFDDILALQKVADTLVSLDRCQEALEYFETALAQAEASEGQGAEWQIHQGMALAYSGLDNDYEALKHLEQALEIVRELQDRAGECQVLMWYGLISGPDEGLTYLEQSLTIAREIGDQAMEQYCLKIMEAFRSGQR